MNWIKLINENVFYNVNFSTNLVTSLGNYLLALRAKKANSTIHSISDPSGKKCFSSSEIATQFKNFYSKLYNISANPSSDQAAHRKHLITEFLSLYSPKPISKLEAEYLECPIDWDESKLALKLKTGKCPGPDGLTVGYYKSFTDTILRHF